MKKKSLIFEGANVFCSDPFVKGKGFSTLENILQKCDIIIIGAPHDIYKDIKFDKHIVIDIWNINN